MALWAEPSQEPFVYRPLDTSKQEIRLLRLIINEQGEVEGFLEHFDVEFAPRYRALSYTWGTDSETKVICLNGRTFRIRRNLFDFFEVYKGRYAQKTPLHGDSKDLSMRRPREIEKEWLWVDQICIDQATTNERNHQVQLMAQIYRHAVQVITWLQKETPRIRMDSFLCDGQCRADRHRQPRNARPCSLVVAVVLHTYWQRVWIMQEVLLARKWVIWYGENVFTGNKCHSLYIWNMNALEIIPRGVAQFLALTHNKRSQGGQEKRLRDAIGIETSRFCNDPRDQIYGILALVREEDRIEVDYSKSVASVFARAVVLMLKDEHPDEVDDPAIYHLARCMGLSMWPLAPNDVLIMYTTSLIRARRRQDKWQDWFRSELEQGITFIAEGDTTSFVHFVLKECQGAPELIEDGWLRLYTFKLLKEHSIT